jgi:hypothetical protein
MGKNFRNFLCGKNMIKKSSALLKFAVFLFASSFCYGCQAVPVKKYEIIRIHNVSEDQLTLIQMGLAENACRDLRVNNKFAEYVSELHCSQGPEEMLNSEILRLINKYSLKKRFEYKDGIYEIY